MNCPSRADPDEMEGRNQNPDALNADATTRADLGHMANARKQRGHRIDPASALPAKIELTEHPPIEGPNEAIKSKGGQDTVVRGGSDGFDDVASSPSGSPIGDAGSNSHGWRMKMRKLGGTASRVLLKYSKFVGPGFMVAVAYIDPGEHELVLLRSLMARSLITYPRQLCD
jgi:metal iron transporter